VQDGLLEDSVKGLGQFPAVVVCVMPVMGIITSVWGADDWFVTRYCTEAVELEGTDKVVGVNGVMVHTGLPA
jgi:hypothetical protein